MIVVKNDASTAVSDRRPPAAPAPRPAPGAPAGGWYRPAKAVLDFVGALLLLALATPFLLLAVVLVKLTSRGPAFYSQTRLGVGGRPFRIYKIRSMYHNCEKDSGVCWSRRDDPRVTPVGWLLRLTHIDELPQLWNVLRGDMSLIGPRPERPEFLPQLEKALPRYRDRLLVRPGLSGLAQVQLPADSDLASVRRKLAHDLYYVARLGFWLDCRILLGTVVYLLRLPSALTRLLVPGGPAVEQAYERGGDAPGEPPAPGPDSKDELPTESLAEPEPQPA